MTDDEIKAVIYKTTEQYNDCYINKIQEKSAEFSDGMGFLKKNVARMQQIESLIHSHAEGVQRVYNELEEIKRLLNTPHLEKIIKLLEMSDEVENDTYLNELQKIINPAFCAQKVIHSFNVFKKEISELNELLDN